MQWLLSPWGAVGAALWTAFLLVNDGLFNFVVHPVHLLFTRLVRSIGLYNVWVRLRTQGVRLMRWIADIPWLRLMKWATAWTLSIFGLCIDGVVAYCKLIFRTKWIWIVSTVSGLLGLAACEHLIVAGYATRDGTWYIAASEHPFYAKLQATCFGMFFFGILPVLLPGVALYLLSQQFESVGIWLYHHGFYGFRWIRVVIQFILSNVMWQICCDCWKAAEWIVLILIVPLLKFIVLLAQAGWMALAAAFAAVAGGLAAAVAAVWSAVATVSEFLQSLIGSVPPTTAST